MQDLPPSYQKKPAGMGCFAKGCVVVAAIMLLIVAALWIGGMYFKNAFGSFISDHPIALHENATTNEQYQAALRKLQPLVMDTGEAVAPIEITADDLNAFIAHDPRLADAKGKCFFTIPGNQLAVDVSTELSSQNNTSHARSAYINGRIVGDVDISGKSVRLTPHKIESLNGKEFPGWAMNNAAFTGVIEGINKDINQKIHENTDLADMVSRIKSSKIENGHLVLTIGPASASTPGAPAASPVASPTPE